MSLEKVLNPEMTDAYFTKSIFARPFGFGKCLPKRKGQVVVWETKPILKEALIYTSRISKYIHKKFQELPRYHLISRQRENKFQVL
jgi:hypothetical protein